MPKQLKLLCGLVFLSLMFGGCFTRSRYNNFNWQLDSLKYYAKKQSKEIAQLRVDLYTKSGEIADKIEMLNTRLSESESQITQINEKLVKGRKVDADSGEVSSISPEARMIYESAYLNYVKGNYDESIDGFKSYIKIAPESALSDNALYWIGECYYAMGKRQDAVNTFNELINKYPESNKKPTAIFKTGIIYEEADELKIARMYFNRVIKEYPNSPEAVLAGNRLNQ
jgi:tol-pal system protein YbgF